MVQKPRKLLEALHQGLTWSHSERDVGETLTGGGLL